ncbi:MAG: hypothetical protein NTU80_01620 [Verrucomicrobia bacterium]|nr:hypothetical protein [Verrucomicrobiota bacterium]
MRIPSPPLLGLKIAFITLAFLAPGCARQTNEPFPVAAYLNTPENLQGNHYTLQAEIDAQLLWKEGTGRLLAVRPLGPDAGSRLSVFIADSLNANLMVAQRYQLELTVRNGGLLYVTALHKL